MVCSLCAAAAAAWSWVSALTRTCSRSLQSSCRLNRALHCELASSGGPFPLWILCWNIFRIICIYNAPFSNTIKSARSGDNTILDGATEEIPLVHGKIFTDEENGEYTLCKRAHTITSAATVCTLYNSYSSHSAKKKRYLSLSMTRMARGECGGGGGGMNKLQYTV